LNRLARDVLERAIPLTWIRGEVSNFVCAASGHCYFTLKEAGAQVRCAMFRSRARLLDWQIRNGMQVELRALVTLFEARGEFQLNVEAIRQAGVGSLYEAFERLKAKLAAEGLFDPARKRPLPRFPRAIGVVTSPKAAALRDVLSVLKRRMPCIPVVVYPTPVQGEGSAESVAAALRAASSRAECDVLVLCRGGGSIEDLWAFNEEVVARAIRDCGIPVVSGVGHETDFTIADFAADLRAPTPSVAAEAVSPDRAVLMRQVAATGERLRRGLRRRLEANAQTLDFLGRRLVHPGERVRSEQRHLRQCALRLCACAAKAIDARRWRLAELARRFRASAPDAARRREQLHRHALRLQAAQAQRSHALAARLAAAGARLEALNPLAVLERGYSIATDREGNVVRDSAALKPGDTLDVRFAHGSARTRVDTLRGAGEDGASG
jgi:exodeoxyribonuclease VII large subunit